MAELCAFREDALGIGEEPEKKLWGRRSRYFISWHVAALNSLPHNLLLELSRVRAREYVKIKQAN